MNDARLTAEKLRTLYTESPHQNTFSALVLGDYGTGKTHLLRTCRFPAHIDSFDPRGTRTLNDLILKGDIIADTQYEVEDRHTPTAFKLWARNFEARVKSGYFNAFGTYMLDSSTTWSDAIMNDVLKTAGLAGETPRRNHDYVPQKNAIQTWMRRILNLPCDVIITGHLKDIFETRMSGNEPVDVLVGKRYLTTGDGSVRIPLLFSEIYVLLTKQKGTQTEYQLLTQPYNFYSARTRLGKLNMFETPNIKEILRKCGLPTEDKPPLFGD